MFHVAIAMLYGICRQFSYAYVFIKDVNHTDLLIIALVMLGVLFWSIIQVYKLGVNAYTYWKPGGDVRKPKKQSKQEDQTQNSEVNRGKVLTEL